MPAAIHLISIGFIRRIFVAKPTTRAKRHNLSALKRDEVVWTWAEAHPGEDVFEGRELDITSQMDISVEDILGKIEQEIAARRP